MIIDAHNHPDFHGYTVEKIIRDMDENNIDVTWLLSWEIPQSEYDVFLNQRNMPPYVQNGIPLESVLNVGKYAKDRFVLGYAPHPKRPDAIERIKSAVDLYGIKLAGEYKSRVVFDDPDSIRLLRAFGELHLPTTIHLEYGTYSSDPTKSKVNRANYPWTDHWYGGTIGSLERILNLCPDTIIIAHGPGWWSHISSDDLYDKQNYPKGKVTQGGLNPLMLRKYPNLYADMSGNSGLNALTRDKEHGKEYIIQNADKLLFARDIYGPAGTKLKEHIDGLSLPMNILDKIMFENAIKLLD